MKKRIFLLLFLLPMIAHAQINQITEEQKQQALRHVTEFCNLLTQWSNGQRTLDTKIYALCSGNDCSAYDDVSTNKETTLRNYLLGIQKKYPRRLSIHLSQPSISNCEIIYEPDIAASFQVGSLAGSLNPYDFNDLVTLNISSYKNAYLAFKIGHTISGHSNNATRLIIYDLKAKKVTAYVAGQGTFVSYLEGLNLMVQGDFRKAIQKFEAAMTNQRSSLNKRCCQCAIFCSGHLGDTQSMIRYGKASGDVIMSKYSDILYLCTSDQKDMTAVLTAINEFEQLNSRSGGVGNSYLPALYYIKALIYSIDDGSNYSPEKSVNYFRKAIKLGHIQSAWMLFETCIHDVTFGDYISVGEIMEHLEWAAEKGHLGAILNMGKLSEAKDPNDKKAPIKWFTKGAYLGDPFCMACLGKALISTGDKANGCYWLRKSLEGNKLEKQLEAYLELITDKWWPRSRSDVQSLLDNNSTPTITNTPSNTSSTSSNNSYQSIDYSTTHSNNTESFHYKKYHSPFNQAKDEYFGGFSMGYIQKQWVVDYDSGKKEKTGMFDNDKYMNGIQAGIRIDPQFGAGFGINSGLFYEYCWAKSKEEYDEYGPYHYTYEEHGIYLPLHLKFTMNFSEWFQLSFYGGAAVNYCISGNMYLKDDDTTYDSLNVFSEDDWRRWNFMLEYGASIRIRALQIDFSMAQGLNDWSDTDGYRLKQGRPLNISMTICI